MHIEFTEHDLRPVIRAVVAEVLAEMAADDARLNGRLAYTEQQAADAIGVPRHVVRDLRLSGELVGSKCGKRIVYEQDVLRDHLRRKRIRNTRD